MQVYNFDQYIYLLKCMIQNYDTQLFDIPGHEQNSLSIEFHRIREIEYACWFK